MRIINFSKRYGRRPSDVLNVQDEYCAFCLDEACAYVEVLKFGNGKSSLSDSETTVDNELLGYLKDFHSN